MGPWQQCLSEGVGAARVARLRDRAAAVAKGPGHGGMLAAADPGERSQPAPAILAPLVGGRNT